MPDVTGGATTAAEWAWLGVVERELFLFAALFLVLGALDELAVDLLFLWLRLTGGTRTRVFGQEPPAALSGPIAVLVPAWQEAAVINATIGQIGAAWPQPDLAIFVGVYRNDPATGETARRAALRDRRVRIATVPANGPTTKADCLNHLYAALEAEERATGAKFRGIVLQDAEDMVHPAAIAAIDGALESYAMVQLPVRPALDPGPRFVSGHYADEFAESHAKAIVVRQALDAPLPSAGVGCAIARDALHKLARERAAMGDTGPFAAESLTEDYELGFKLRALGLPTVFLRLRDAGGRLIATESYFPDALGPAARQKARWVHGIAFQGWDRLGWDGSWADRWMKLRDRRGPLAALVLAVAYLLLTVEAAIVLTGAPHAAFGTLAPAANLALSVLVASLVWRIGVRGLFVWREYGPAEALRSIARIPVANIIAIMAGWRALWAYVRSLSGDPPPWEKTVHLIHPATRNDEIAG